MISLIFILSAVCILFFLSVSWLWVFVTYELSLFPMLLMILIFGVQFDRISAFTYMMIYTVLFTLPLMWLVLQLPLSLGKLVYAGLVPLLILIAAFGVKFPVYFMHLWLPKAHVEAPTVASILLAAVLLKLGTIGLVKVLLNFSFGEALIMPLLMIAFMGMVLASAIAPTCSDMKSLVAYSSICHMGLVFLALLTSSTLAFSGSVLMMVIHGFCSSLLFFTVGLFYHSLGTRKSYFLSGSMMTSLILSSLILLSLVVNFSVPPSMGFVSEVLMLYSSFSTLILSVVVIGGYIMLSCYFSLFALLNMMSSTPSSTAAGDSTITTSAAMFIPFIVMSFNMILPLLLT